MTKETADVWHDDYYDRLEGKGIYKHYVEPEYDPDAEADYGRMNTAMSKLQLTVEDLNEQHRQKLERMQQLADAINHLKYLTRGNK